MSSSYIKYRLHILYDLKRGFSDSSVESSSLGTLRLPFIDICVPVRSPRSSPNTTLRCSVARLPVAHEQNEATPGVTEAFSQTVQTVQL